MALLDLDRVSVSFGGLRALSELSLSVDAGPGQSPVIAQGAPTDIRRNPAVIGAYLGQERVGSARA